MRGLPLISLLSNYLRTIKSTTHVRVAHLFGQNLKKVFLPLKEFLTSEGIGHDRTRTLGQRATWLWFLQGEYTFAVKYNNVVQSDFWHQSPPNGSPMISSCQEDHH